MPRPAILLLGVLAFLSALFYQPISRYAIVQGYYRRPDQIKAYHGLDLRIIPNSMQCEDMHLDKSSGLIFAACQTGNPMARYQWWPPLGLFSMKGGQGTIVVIDTRTFTSTALKFEGFDSTFDNHGMEIYSDPLDPSQIYIYAINHKPNPDFPTKSPHHSNPVIEIFRYTVGRLGKAIYLRSVSHPNIRTPNDILSTSLSTFYITNDHYHREGRLRGIEGYLGSLGSWSDVVYVSLDAASLARAHNASIPTPQAEEMVDAVSAIKGLHTPNGLGRGNHLSPDGVMLTDAGRGILMCALSFHTPDLTTSSSNNALKISDHKPLEIITVPTGIDNPFWFADPNPDVGFDASGYILAGGVRNWDENADAEKFALQGLDASKAYGPSIVWYVRLKLDKAPVTPESVQEDTQSIQAWEYEMVKGYNDKWERKILYQDTGRLTRGGSTAVMVGIDPKTNDGKKEAWLFVTGYFSMNIIAVKVNLM